MSITQQEFEYLISLQKQFDDASPIDLSLKWTRELSAVDTNDKFIIDYYMGSVRIEKYTYNKRYRKSIILLRYDSVGRHTNPDGVVFEGPHVHIYRENFDDKFAFPVTEIGLSEDQTSRDNVLSRFLQYCNITNPPSIQSTIFQ